MENVNCFEQLLFRWWNVWFCFEKLSIVDGKCVFVVEMSSVDGKCDLFWRNVNFSLKLSLVIVTFQLSTSSFQPSAFSCQVSVSFQCYVVSFQFSAVSFQFSVFSFGNSVLKNWKLVVTRPVPVFSFRSPLVCERQAQISVFSFGKLVSENWELVETQFSVLEN